MTTASTSGPFETHQPFRFVAWFRSRPLARWHARYLQRMDLAEIDDHLLRDLGLTPDDVRRECTKPFWRP